MKKFLILVLLVSITSMTSAKESNKVLLNKSPTNFVLSKAKSSNLINTKTINQQCRLQCKLENIQCRNEYGIEACIENFIACYSDCVNQ